MVPGESLPLLLRAPDPSRQISHATQASHRRPPPLTTHSHIPPAAHTHTHTHTHTTLWQLKKWQSVEILEGGPVSFANMSILGVYDVGPSWWQVVTPLWTSDVLVTGIAAFALCWLCSLGRSIAGVAGNRHRNQKLLHMNTLAQVAMNVSFKCMLVKRLVSLSLATPPT